MIRKYLPILLIVLLGISIYLISKKEATIIPDEANYEFKLNTINGPITSDSLKGKAVVLYFGYMFCPDICPTTLYDISKAFKNLTQDEINNTQVIFVSVDPDRDSIQGLDDYVKYFHKDFIGATSTQEIIKETTNRFRAYYKFEKQENSALKYTVAHTTRIYVLNKEGKLAKTVSTHNVDTKLISDAIKLALD